MKNNKRLLIISLFTIIGILFITVGTTYAFFTYAKKGIKNNSITTATLKFVFDENIQDGNQIIIEDALPMTDENGMNQSNPNEIYNFQIRATNTGSVDMNYEITVNKDLDSTVDESKIKLYLTEVVEDANGDKQENSLALKKFSELQNPTNSLAMSLNDKLLYSNKVAANTSTYEKNFNLRLWITDFDELDGDYDYTPYEFKNSEGNLLTGYDYYSLTEEEQAKYSRIAYVNNTTKTALTEAEYEAYTGSDKADYIADEQLYMLNGLSFSMRINVYSNASA